MWFEKTFSWCREYLLCKYLRYCNGSALTLSDCAKCGLGFSVLRIWIGYYRGHPENSALKNELSLKNWHLGHIFFVWRARTLWLAANESWWKTPLKNVHIFYVTPPESGDTIDWSSRHRDFLVKLPKIWHLRQMTQGPSYFTTSPHCIMIINDKTIKKHHFTCQL